MPRFSKNQFTLGQLEIRIHHHRGQGADVGLGFPAQQLAALAGVAFQVIHLGGPEVAGIDLHILLPVQIQAAEGEAQEIADADALAGGHHVVVRLLLLEHAPHGLHVVTREAPVAPGVEVAQPQLVLEAELDAGGGAGDLAGHEGLAAARALVVEEDAVAGEEAVAFAVVDHLVVRENLSAGIGAAGFEAGALMLARLGAAEHLRAARLVEADGLAAVLHVAADGLQQPDHAHAHYIHGVLRLIEAHAHMALGPQVVDLVGLHIVEHIAQGARIGEIAVVQEEVWVRRLTHVQMVDAVRVEEAGPPDDAMHLIALGQQQFGQVAAVLAGDAGDECDAGHGNL